MGTNWISNMRQGRFKRLGGLGARALEGARLGMVLVELRVPGLEDQIGLVVLRILVLVVKILRHWFATTEIRFRRPECSPCHAAVR